MPLTFFLLFVYTLFSHILMPGYDYRALNAAVAKAPAHRLKLLLESVKKPNPVAVRSKPIQKLPRACNRRAHINDGFKLAMVQLRFGSLEDTNVIR